MSIQQLLDQYSKLPRKDVRILDSADDLDDINSGILFIMAPWSADALRGFQLILAVLAEHDPPQPALVVADIDRLSPSLLEKLPVLHGKGETFWIHRGRIIAKLDRYEKGVWKDAIVRNNRLFASAQRQ